MIPKTIDDCWHLATDEAKRYQSMLTESMSGIERIKWTARRDQSARLARLIKFGTTDKQDRRLHDEAVAEDSLVVEGRNG